MENNNLQLNDKKPSKFLSVLETIWKYIKKYQVATYSLNNYNYGCYNCFFLSYE